MYIQKHIRSTDGKVHWRNFSKTYHACNGNQTGRSNGDCDRIENFINSPWSWQFIILSQNYCVTCPGKKNITSQKYFMKKSTLSQICLGGQLSLLWHIELSILKDKEQTFIFTRKALRDSDIPKEKKKVFFIVWHLHNHFSKDYARVLKLWLNIL